MLFLFFLFIFSVRFITCAPSFLSFLLPIRSHNSQIRGRKAGGSSPSSPLRFLPCIFVSQEENGSCFPRRLASVQEGDPDSNFKCFCSNCGSAVIKRVKKLDVPHTKMNLRQIGTLNSLMNSPLGIAKYENGIPTISLIG